MFTGNVILLLWYLFIMGYVEKAHPTLNQTALSTPMYPAVQSQKAVSAHFSSKQILPFGYAG